MPFLSKILKGFIKTFRIQYFFSCFIIVMLGRDLNFCMANPKIPDTAYLHMHGNSDGSVELLSWGKDTVISARERKDIYLASYPPQHAVAVLIVNDVPWTDSSLRNMSGEFTIHAPAGHGVSAVVQVMYLRRNAEHCLDYIQLYDPVGAKGSGKICGKLSKENKAFKPSEVIGGRTFRSSSGLIQVQYKSARGDPNFPSDKNYDLSFHMVEIVFTTYNDCPSDADLKRLTISGEFPSFPCGAKCISPLLVCDERINCAHQQDFAKDEEGCEYFEGREGEKGGEYLLALYLGVALFLVMLLICTLYYQQRAYKLIRNIPIR